MPKTAWKLKQQQGRVGRDGSPAVDITLVFPQKGNNIKVGWNSKCKVCAFNYHGNQQALEQKMQVFKHLKLYGEKLTNEKTLKI